MAMHKVPTLVLGIGGIGCRIAANISSLLTPEAHDRVAIVGIDTNVNDLAALADRGVRTIQTSDNRNVGEYLLNHPEHLVWFPVNPFTATKSLLNGAGQIRAVSRLGALAAEERGSFIALKDEIQRIRANRGDNSNGNLTVMVVGSITGGTGAGLFLQIPFYIRKLMRNEAGLDNIIIRGMFVGADLTVGVQPSRINREAVRVNAYACIKELNAMYSRQLSDSELDHLKVDFYTPRSREERERISANLRFNWDQLEEPDAGYGNYALHKDAETIARGNPDIPYDYLYLIEGTNSDGSIGTVHISSVEALVARMVHTLMFTPVKDNALSVEDNMVLHDAMYNGMNRYSSAGMTTLIYPQDMAREYVTLCTVRDLVRNEWMVIDNEFRAEVTEARTRQRTDGKAEIPQLKTAFTKLFRKQVTGEGSLGNLFNEAFIVTPERVELPRSNGYLNGINELIDELMESDEVKAFKEACNLNDGKMNTFTSAQSEISRVYMALDDFEKLAKSLAKDRPVAIANEMFPPSVATMQQNRGNSHNICHLLENVHPLTARFLCYDMIQQLEERIKDMSGSVSGMALDDYLNEDFDPKEKDIQKPGAALRKIQEKQIPVLGLLTSEASKIKRLKDKLSNVTQAQSELIAQYLRDSLDLAVCRILLDRIEALAENYSTFFGSIGAMVLENNSRIEKLEQLELPLGQEGIYCSKTAFRSINAEFQSSVDSELPVQTKNAIFDNLFNILATDFEDSYRILSEHQKAHRAAAKSAALEQTFQKAVVDTIRTTVIEKGAGIVDMTARQALERQFGLKDCDESRNLDFPTYVRTLINRAMKMAAPMMAASSGTVVNDTATAYIAIHPDCASTEMGRPNVGATKSFLAPVETDETGNVDPTILLDSAFSPQEIICFRAKYKFSIEDLTKYTYESENACAYRERIAKLGKMPARTGNPDDCLTVINPHLDRYWHEEAYLPALYRSERDRDSEETYKAFIYAMGLDRFQRMKDENSLNENGEARVFWYYQYGRNFIPVKIRNNPIGNSCTELFNSLRYNRRIKQDILAYAARYVRDQKGFCVAEELYEKIMDDTFIQDLILPESLSTTPDDQNILNILLRMRDGMKNSEWLELVNALQTVLWEYCGYLFDRSERLVNLATRAILEKMYTNSVISGKEESAMTYSERELKKAVKEMYSTVYHRQ